MTQEATQHADDETETTETETTTETSSEDLDENLSVIIQKQHFQQVLDQLSATVAEAIFRLGRDGLEVTCVDPANVAMTDIHLTEDAFESVGDGKFPIGLNIEKLVDHLKFADTEELIQLTYRPETRMLNIHFGNTSVDIASIDPQTIRDEPTVPDIPFCARAALDASLFLDGVKQCKIASDHLQLTADDEAGSLELLGGGDTDDVTITYEREDLHEGKFEEHTRALYSIDYLTGKHGILDDAPSDASLSVEFANEYPVKYEYDFADGNGHAMLTVAPRIARD